MSGQIRSIQYMWLSWKGEILGYLLCCFFILFDPKQGLLYDEKKNRRGRKLSLQKKIFFKQILEGTTARPCRCSPYCQRADRCCWVTGQRKEAKLGDRCRDCGLEPWDQHRCFPLCCGGHVWSTASSGSQANQWKTNP